MTAQGSMGSKIILLRLLSAFSVLTITSCQKECFRRNSDGFQLICCDNHVRNQTNNVCVECQLGTKSKNEEPCTPCSPRTYGRKCLYICDCKTQERCDIEVGCVLNNQSYVKSEITITTWTNANNQHTTNVKDGASKGNIILVSVGLGGSFVFILSVVSLGLCLRKYKSKLLKNVQLAQQSDLNITDNETDENDSLYESIDESAIYDDNILIPNQQDSLEYDKNEEFESKLSSTESEISGYLNPYTTFIEKETHLYSTNTNYSNNISPPVSSENIKGDSGYTHPYQQLQQEHKQLQTAQKSDYTELTVVHFLELVDFHNNIGSASPGDIPDIKDSKRNSCGGEGIKNVHQMRHSPFAKFYSLQHMKSPFEINCHDFTNDNMNQTIKHNSI